MQACKRLDRRSIFSIELAAHESLQRLLVISAEIARDPPAEIFRITIDLSELDALLPKGYRIGNQQAKLPGAHAKKRQTSSSTSSPFSGVLHGSPAGEGGGA